MAVPARHDIVYARAFRPTKPDIPGATVITTHQTSGRPDTIENRGLWLVAGLSKLYGYEEAANALAGNTNKLEGILRSWLDLGRDDEAARVVRYVADSDYKVERLRGLSTLTGLDRRKTWADLKRDPRELVVDDARARAVLHRADSELPEERIAAILSELAQQQTRRRMRNRWPSRSSGNDGPAGRSDDRGARRSWTWRRRG